MRRILFLFVLLPVLQSLVHAESNDTRLLSGLWNYEKISHGGDAALPNKGLFLFYDGRFYQQTIDDDMGQAHVGSYTITGNTVSFDIEMGVLVRENSDTPLAVRQNAENQANISFNGDALILSFDENTVQTLTKLADVENAKIFPLNGGYLVFTDSIFIYMKLEDGEFEAGSGSYSKAGKVFSLDANPWISVSGRRVKYSYNKHIDLDLEQKTLGFPDGSKHVFKMREAETDK